MTRTKFTRTLNTHVSSASDRPVSRGDSTAGERACPDCDGRPISRNMRRYSENLWTCGTCCPGPEWKPQDHG